MTRVFSGLVLDGAAKGRFIVNAMPIFRYVLRPEFSAHWALGATPELPPQNSMEYYHHVLVEGGTKGPDLSVWSSKQFIDAYTAVQQLMEMAATGGIGD
jgi:hypothetical protein